MLAHIVTIVPTCLPSYYSNILPRYSDVKIPVYSHGVVKLVNIINYFILNRQLNFAKIVYLSTDLRLYGINGGMDDILYLLSDISCTAKQAHSIITDLRNNYTYSYKLNDIHRHLYSITRDPRIPGYCHVTGYKPDYNSPEDSQYFDVEEYLWNYKEVEYILGRLNPKRRTTFCDEVISAVNKFNRIDPRSVKLILDHCKNPRETIYYALYYAIAYDKLPEYITVSNSLIFQVLDTLYSSKPMHYVINPHDLEYINMFESLLTTDDRMLRMENFLLSQDVCLKHVPVYLLPNTHRVIAKIIVTHGWNNIKFKPDDCEWCQKLHHI